MFSRRCGRRPRSTSGRRDERLREASAADPLAPDDQRPWEQPDPVPSAPGLTCGYRVVGATGIEPVTSSVSGKRSPAELSARGGGGNRTRVQGFAGPCLSHSATPPTSRGEAGRRPTPEGVSERTTGFEPATLTLA